MATQLAHYAVPLDEKHRWFETRLWIRDKIGRLIPFIMNPVQQQYAKIKRRVVRKGKKPFFLVLKGRKEGISTYEQAESYYLVATTPYQHCITVAQSHDDTSKLFEISNLFFKEGWGDAKPDRAATNKREFRFHNETSLFYIGTAGSEAFGRSQTPQRVHGSEVAWWRGSIERQRNYVAGLTEAATHGEVVMESTPNGIKGWFYHEWEAARKGDSAFTPIFLAWWWDPTNRIYCTPAEAKDIMNELTDEETVLVKAKKLDAAQIKWRRDKKRSLKRLFIQEYPEDPITCFIVSGQCFFEKELIRKLMYNCPPPTQERMDGALRFWKMPHPDRRYIIGVDCASGEADDYCVAVVLDWETVEQVAVLRGKWRPHIFGRLVAKLGHQYNTAFLGIERNNHGHSVLNTVLNQERYPRGRVYRHLVYDSRENKRKERIGWDTNSETRPVMLDTLYQYMDEGTLKVNDPDFLSECLVFDENQVGKAEAQQGEHDDTVIANAIACQLRSSKRFVPSVDVLGVGDEQEEEEPQWEQIASTVSVPV